MTRRAILIVLVISAYLLVCALAYLGLDTSRTNATGWFLTLTAIAYGLGGPYLLWSNLKKESTTRAEQGDRSFWLVLPGFLTVFYAPPLEYLYLPRVLPRLPWMQAIGLGLIVASLVLFTWARLALRGFYSGRVRVQAGHVLVQQGPYRIIRHPAYTAYIIMSLGIATGYSSLIGLVSSLLLLVPGLIYRLKVEEKLLMGEFGDAYDQYARSTKRLIPGIW